MIITKQENIIIACKINNTRIVVDLAKDVIQVCIYTKKMLSNIEVTEGIFFLINQ
jgi:hypothetical protein